MVGPMTNEELKEALLYKRPVIVSLADGTEIPCKWVSGIIYRARMNSIIVSAEVLDRNGKCIYNCKPKQIRYEV